METSVESRERPVDYDLADQQATNLAGIIVARPIELFNTGHLLPGDYAELLRLLSQNFGGGLEMLNHLLMCESGGKYVMRQVAGMLLRDEMQVAIGAVPVEGAPVMGDVLTTIPTVMLLTTAEGFIVNRGAMSDVIARRQTKAKFAAALPFCQGIYDDLLDYMAKLILDETGPHTRETLDALLVNGGLPQFMAACDMVGLNFLDLFIESYKNVVIEDD